MRLTRTRGFSRYSQPDFDQERANLTEGYQNYAQEADASTDSVLRSSEYTTAQKKQFLQAVKEDLQQKSLEYREKMQQIDEAEAQYLSGSIADSYCCFSDLPGQQSLPASENYCGTVAGEDTESGYTADHGHSNDM